MEAAVHHLQPMIDTPTPSSFLFDRLASRLGSHQDDTPSIAEDLNHRVVRPVRQSNNK